MTSERPTQVALVTKTIACGFFANKAGLMPKFSYAPA